ncbi:MAG: glycerophosphodiester phosphodiesterase [Gemmatimonadetes bacterium]|nr:glycerophosphodiester phosphodiesterase [Gemmatimonadota bacterium]
MIPSSGAVLVVAAAWRTRRPVRTVQPVLAGGPLLIAHRGGAALAPENTLAAFLPAVHRLGVDMIELDVRATADGRCVVIHDPTVDRTTNGTGTVAELTWAEISRLDAGYRFTADGGRTYPFRGTGVTIPAIDDVLQALPDTRFTVEVKTAAAQQDLFDAIERFAAADRIIAAGMYDVDRAEFARHSGAISASTEQMRMWLIRHWLRLGRLSRLRADVAQVPEIVQGRRIVTQRMIRDLRNQGVAVHVWTVNSEADMRRLLEWGVDGLVTDRPDLAATILHTMTGRPLPRHAGDPDGAA